MKAIAGHEFAKALEAAGVISDLTTIERIVIDVTHDRVDVHVKRFGDHRLLDVAGLLVPGEVRGVRYWVLVSRELLDTDPPWAAVGLRLVERGGWENSWENGRARWCMVEDPEAPAELEGRQVEILITEEDGKPRITGRQVTG